MVKILAKLFIKNSDDITNPQVRGAYGMLCGALGIFLNVLLFAGKFFAGTISNSVSITADAFNNLSDAGSSAITLIGFKLAGQKPDPEHPFGHGRMEYLSGLVVAMAILLMGYELVTSSIEKIIHPQAVEFSTISAVILVISIGVKLYMGIHNKQIGTQIDSAAMKATGADCTSDCIATAVVLAAAIVGRFTNLVIDGWCGLLVSMFIIKAGIEAAKDTISPLLGQKPDEEFVDSIYGIVMAHPEVLGVHDLIVHDYGPGRLMITLHAEVSASADLMYTHDAIDNIENELCEKLGCQATIHMDPIADDDTKVVEIRDRIARGIAELYDGQVSIHDFRMVEGPTHTNVIFDIVIPHNFAHTEAQVEAEVKKNVAEMDGGIYRAVVKVEYNYV